MILRMLVILQDRTSFANCLALYLLLITNACSLLLVLACDGLFSDLVLKNEFQSHGIHKDVMVGIFDWRDSTVRVIFHTFLDVILRLGISLLIHGTFNKQKKTSTIQYLRFYSLF